MQGRSRSSLAALGVVLSLFVDATVFAGGEDPPGCNGISVAIAVEALVGGSPTLDPTIDGTEIFYRVTIVQPFPTFCNLFGGELSITFPNGSVVPLAGFGGPTPDVPVINVAVPFQVVSVVPYIASTADTIDGFATARSDYGSTGDQPQQQNGTFLTDPPLTIAASTSALPLFIDPDCNENGWPDVFDILDGTSDDLDGNGIPDECNDCNDNLVADDLDIAMGVSEDCNADQLPDECDIGFPGEATWTGASGGLFRHESSWDRGTPASTNPVRFVPAGSLDVLFDSAACDELLADPMCLADYCNERLRVNSGDVRIDLGGVQYELLTSVMPGVVVAESTGQNARLELTSSAMNSMGLLAAGTGRIGDGPGTIGEIMVTGATAELFFSQDLCIGCAGTGTLRIDDGARVVARDAIIGDFAGSDGVTILTGNNSMWDILFFLTVNNGELRIGPGATVTAGFDVFGGVFLFEDARLSGSGTIDGTVVNFGELAPGETTGTLTIDGGYHQIGQIEQLGSSSGSLRIEIAGTAPGEFDRLSVTGPVGLGGGLFIDLTDGFVPGVGQQFELLDAPLISETERFDVAFTPGLPDSRFLQVEYGAANTAGPTGTVSVVVGELLTLLGYEPDPRSVVAVGDLPSDVAAADLDDDGDLDLAITVPDSDPMANGTLFVLFNGGTDLDGVWNGYTGVLQIPVGANPTAVVAGAINPDAPIDLAVTNGGDDTVMVLFNTTVVPGEGSFGLPTVLNVGTSPSDIGIAELNGQTGLDLVVTNEGDNTFSVLNNDGTGGFAIIDTMGSGGDCPSSVDPEDIDDDRDEDLVITHQCSGTVVIIMNESLGPVGPPGAGPFAAPIVLPVDDGPTEVITADLDLDALGLPEIITVNESSGTVSIIRNLTGTTFAPAVNLPIGDGPRSITAVNMENDADLDLAVVVSNGMGERVVRILRNDLFGGQLVIADAEDLDTGGTPVLVTSGDVDDDGDGDLIAVNESGNNLTAPPTGSRGTSGEGDLAANGAGPRLGGSVLVELNTLFLPCPGDTDGSGAVDINDLVNVVLDFGTDGSVHGGDVNGSGLVDIDDIVEVVLNFGACPGT